MEYMIFAVIIVLMLLSGAYAIKRITSVDFTGSVKDEFTEVLQWADIFVRAVKDSHKEATGAEKRELAIQYIKEVCDNLELQISDAQIEAIVRAAYVDMKSEEIILDQEITITSEEDTEDVSVDTDVEVSDGE